LEGYGSYHYIIRPNCTEPLEIISFTGTGGTLNPDAGGSIIFKFTVEPSPYDSARITINGQDIGGTAWNGMLNGKIASPGTYTAKLTVIKGGQTATASTPVTVTGYAGCPLMVQVGSSANVASGELANDLNLFSASGTGTALDLSLYYGSLDSYDGPLGMGWSHSYDAFVAERANGEVLLRDGSGGQKLYTPSGAGYLSPSGDYSTLGKNAAGHFLLTRKDGTRYEFGGDGKIASITDRNGNALSFAYAGELLQSVTDAAGRSVTFSYAGDKLAFVTDPSGHTYHFTVGERLESVTFTDGGTLSYAYGDNDFLTAKTDPLGNLTTYAYDEQHRVVSSTDPEGRIRTIAYPQGDETVRTTTFTEKDGGLWQYTYDTSAGDLLAKTNPEGNTTSYSYDANHNQLTKTDASGTTSYTYDAAGNMTTVTDVAGQTTSYTYSAFGQVTSITDPEGDVTAYEYDDKGNLTKTTDPTGVATGYTYDSAGHVTSVTDALGRTTAMTYDVAGNMTGVTDPAGNTIRFEYDANGRMFRQTDPQGNVTTFEYDARGNLIRTVDPLGNATAYSYDAKGNKVSTTDAHGNTTIYEYDSQGQMVKMTDAEGNVTEFAYGGSVGCSSCSGGADKLTSLIDANGNTTHFTYNTLGRLIEETDPLGNVTSYGYDARGNMTSKTDAKGQTITYSYDSLGRLLKKSYPDSTSATFTYDAKGNILTAANEHIAYTYNYDQSNRVTDVTDSLGRTLSYEYNKLGKKTKMIAPDGKQLRYEYDTAGRLAAILNGGNTTFTYDDLGRRATMIQPNGVMTTYNYDDAGRLTEIIAADSSGRIVAKSAYTHDKVGNRLSRADTRSTMSYGYDKTYQLLEAIDSAPGFSAENGKGKKGKGVANAVQNQKEFYAYDPVGNRTTSSEHRSYAHNADNQLLSADGTNFEYDKNGNLILKTTEEGTTAYTWDAENRLVRVDLPDGAVLSFKYDPFGRRIEKKSTDAEGTKTTRYVYDNEDILFETDETADIGNRYIHGPGIDEPLALIDGKNTYYYHADGLGSVIALTDDRGRVVQDCEYDSLGNLHDQKNRIKQPYTYTGREWDRETGLYFYRARYYDPMEGRFISKDPIGFKGGINLYSYTDQNPVNFIDPYGLRTWTINRMGAGASLAVVGASGQYVTFESNCEDGYKIIKRYLVGGIGLTVGLQVNTIGPSKGELGGITFMKEPDPISGISVSGPSLGVGYGGTLGSASTDFNSYGEGYGANHGWMAGASIFNFEGQFYFPVGESIEKCCEGEK
jgi:RHS repeat-associated protein